MRPMSLLPLLWRWLWVLIAAGVLSGLAGYAVVSQVQPTYESSVQLLTGPVNTDFETLRAAGELARTYAELAITRPVLQQVAAEIRLDGGVEELEERVQVTANTVSRLVTVSVENASPTLAAETATAISDHLMQLEQMSTEQQTDVVEVLLRRNEISALPVEVREAVQLAAEAVLAEPQAGRLTVVNPADVPTDPVAPPEKLITVLAALAGTLIAMVAIILRDLLTPDTVDSEEFLSELAALPILGSVTAFSRRGRGGSVLPREMNSCRAGEGYRLLATKVGLLNAVPTVRRLLVVPCDDHLDAGGVAAGLAAVVSAGDRSVTLIDADAERRQLTRLFGLDGQPGWSELLGGPRGQSNSAEAASRSMRATPNLDLLPVGTGAMSSIDPFLVGSLLNELPPSRSELVVVSVSPVARASGNIAWLGAVDACLVLVRLRRTTLKAVQDTVQGLSVTGVNLAGIVFVDGRQRLSAYASAEPSPAGASESKIKAT